MTLLNPLVENSCFPLFSGVVVGWFFSYKLSLVKLRPTSIAPMLTSRNKGNNQAWAPDVGWDCYRDSMITGSIVVTPQTSKIQTSLCQFNYPQNLKGRPNASIKTLINCNYGVWFWGGLITPAFSGLMPTLPNVLLAWGYKKWNKICCVCCKTFPKPKL